MIDIRREVIKQLDRLYPNIPIYGEEVQQGFKEPSFYVKVLDTSRDKQLSTRYVHEVVLDIHYFTTTNENAEQMANELYEHMETLEGVKLRGTKMKHEVSDKVLHFFIDYKMHLVKDVKEDPKMERLEGSAYAK